MSDQISDLRERILTKFSSSTDFSLANSLIESINLLIPEERLANKYCLFARSSGDFENIKIEVALVTSNFVLNDFVYTRKNRTHTFIHFSPITWVTYKSSYSSETEIDIPSDFSLPYRFELEISSADNKFRYLAEGNRRHVQDLTIFALGCSIVMNQIKS